jgi:hypothetical protein
MGESRSDGGIGCLILIGLAAVFLFFAWPYYLGTWLAVEFGADNPSTARHVTGWVLQGLWLTLLASVPIGWWLAARRQRAADSRRRAREQQRELTEKLHVADSARRAPGSTTRPRR